MLHLTRPIFWLLEIWIFHQIKSVVQSINTGKICILTNNKKDYDDGIDGENHQI